MTELDDFLADMLPRQIEADRELHNGDAGPRAELWTRQDPVTLHGAAGMTNSGWDEISQTFEWVASSFSDCSEFRFELIAAGVSGDLAYTVGFEHSVVSRGDAEPAPNTLRVTHVYRREDGEWKIVHRHGS
jgi:ketosteroid isomerase-like protein